MKKLFPLLFLVVLTKCAQKTEELDMPGAYSMIGGQTMNDGSKDTVINRKQLKIFTNDHVIYAAVRLPDSVASYGIGTYEVKDGNVIENFFYTSANAARNFSNTLKIEKTGNGYKQVIEEIPFQGKNYRLSEEYELVGKADSTPLDGAWKQVENYFITQKGDSSTNHNLTEFKVYEDGHFIWAANYPDSSKKILTFLGFGKFTMDGNNTSREINSYSTYPSLIDTTMTIGLEFIGKDSYKQTIVNPDSSRSVEIYNRLRKF